MGIAIGKGRGCDFGIGQGGGEVMWVSDTGSRFIDKKLMRRVSGSR